ncbi:MAG: HEAT repeat domain-containing protein [Candidatus Electrothrix scaldis]|nr:MAG: HEAT repeat domain-containing protein [Candidatus Electrothrix sp. GW3-3]
MIDDGIDYPKETSIRLIIYHALKDFSDDILINLLSDSNVLVRSEASRQLQLRGTSEHLSKIIELSHSNSDMIREITAYTLSQYGKSKGMPLKNIIAPVLLEMTDDSFAEVRSLAVQGLGNCSVDGMDDVIEEKILSMVKDPDSGVRECVAFALHNSSGSERVQKKLEKLKRDANDDVVDYAVMAEELLKEK